MPKFITVTQDKTKYHVNVDSIQYIHTPHFIIGSVLYTTEIKTSGGLICCKETENEIMEMIND